MEQSESLDLRGVSTSRKRLLRKHCGFSVETVRPDLGAAFSYEWTTLAGWLDALPGSGVLRASPTAYLLVNAAHILGIALHVGAIWPLDLALAGVLRGPALGVLAPFASRVAATELALAIATGLYLVSVRPSEYLANPAFLAKTGLLALALLNIAVQHVGPGWRRVLEGERRSQAVRVIAITSAGLWVSVLVSGRWIGFV